MTDYEPYEANQEDIAKIIAYMKKTNHPEDATPEYAIKFLKKYQTIFNGLVAVLTDEEMKKLYDEFTNEHKRRLALNPFYIQTPRFG